jgi:hypothetical protein
MRFRLMIGVMAVAAASIVSAVGGAASAHAATTCTWGGTPVAPTGTTTNRPGLTNFPAPEPLRFYATGDLAGNPGCTGKLTFIGEMAAGSTCAAITFEANAIGLPGVDRVVGESAFGLAPARLYDKQGNVVGSENSQFFNNAPFEACNTPEGFTEGTFTSVIELF